MKMTTQLVFEMVPASFRNACDIPAVREAIGLAEGRQVVCVLALGYPNVRYLRTAPRKAREIKYL